MVTIDHSLLLKQQNNLTSFITSLQVGVFQSRFLVSSKSPLLLGAVRIASDELSPRNNVVLSFIDPLDGEAFAVDAAVPEPFGRGVEDPAAGSAAVGDRGRGLVVRADPDAHVVAEQISEKDIVL